MSARRRSGVLLVVLLVGVVAGSGLGALAHFPPNDACTDFGALGEGSSRSGSFFDLAPFGLVCEYTVNGRIVSFAPTTGELLAWIALAAALAAFALLRRDSPLARGAACAAALLALAGPAGQLAFTAALGTAIVFGPPLIFVLDHLLRPAGARSRGASLLCAVTLTPLVLLVFLVFLFLAGDLEPIGVVSGVVAGALASVALARTRPAPHGDLLPSG
jgi:hypothetical protein